MKPNNAALKVEGKLPSAGRRMDIDPASMAYILRMVIDLYSDKELAPLRELSTNAYDSHVMAGNDRPIEVQTPTPLSPYLVVKDYGVGLSEEEVYELWGRLGASTKRDSNEVNGMLGVGSKSPLTYTNQFTMTCCKDGMRSVVAVTRDEDGVGRVTLVDSSPSPEPDGVEVKIPAKSQNQFEAKARNLFRFWKKGTVLLNGKEPEGLQDAMEITPTIFMMRDGNYHSESVVVMGNVPYPCPELDASHLGLPGGYSIVAYVPIGAVEFAPAREALSTTKRTREAIERVKIEFKQGLTAAIQADVDKQKSGLEAMAAAHRWLPLMANGTSQALKWQGVTLEPNFRVTQKQVIHPNGRAAGWSEPAQMLRVLSLYSWSKHSAEHDPGNVALSTLMNSVYVVDFTAAKITPTMHKKFVQWYGRAKTSTLLHQQTPITRAIWLDYKPEFLKLIPAERIVTFDTINAEKLPKNLYQQQGGRLPGSYDVVIPGANNLPFVKQEVAGKDIDQSSPVFWFHGNARNATYLCKGLLAYMLPKYTVICLPANRVNKFKRENPKIKNLIDGRKDAEAALLSKLTKRQKEAIVMVEECGVEKFKQLTNWASKIDDPAVQRAIGLANVNLSWLSPKVRGEIDLTGWVFEDPMDRYPLLSNSYRLLWGSNAEHYIRYMNNEYAFQKGAKP